MDVVLGEGEDFAVGAFALVGDGPVAAEDHSVLAEGVPQDVEIPSVVSDIGWCRADGALQVHHAGELAEHVGPFGGALDEIDGVGFWVVAVHFDAGTVVDDDTQLGDGIGDFERALAASEVEGEIAVREQAELFDVIGIPAARTDAAVDRILREAIEVGFEGVVVGIEVADEADDERVVLREVEDPLIVFDPFAALDDDDAIDASGHCDILTTIGAGRFVEDGVVLGWPGGALGARGVVKMDVGVYDH